MASKKAGKKRKAHDITELKADSIDNTAPVHKILDDVQQRNPKAYQFYYQNLRQRRTNKQYLLSFHNVVPGYPLNAFGEDWNGQLNFDYFERFPYKSYPPKYITSLRHIDKCDPVTKYMKEKLDWKTMYKTLKITASKYNVIEKFEDLNGEVVRCPKLLVDMAAHFESRPDPYFDSTYNWYYAGNGNLQLVCLDWIDYLLYSELNCVYLSQFNKDEVFIKSDSTATFQCDDDEHILETISSNNIVVLRTRNKVYILKLVANGEEFQFEKMKIIQSELPYTSVNFDDHHKNILYVTTLDYKLAIVNLDRMKARSVQLSAKLTSLFNNWNSVMGAGRGMYTHVTKKSIAIYDKRANNCVGVYKELKHVMDEITCNEISVARHFEGSHYLYFATDHHLFKMDLRYQQNGKMKVVQRWTHGMEVVPTYMSYCNFEYIKDLICLGSQWCEDMCLIPNYNDRALNDTETGGMTIPYRPPSILDAFNEAREKMLCCDLYNPIDLRLRTAITGTLPMEQGEKYNILLLNSLGDISCHTIFPEHLDTFLENDAAQCLDEWAQSYRTETKEFEVSSIENIANVLSKLRKMPPDYKIEGGWSRKDTKFSEKEITEIFENEEIDCGLQEVWTKSADQTVDQSSFALNLFYSDDENET
ncbi:uncharacterized protein LOC121734300 [Aricia agestis]|uniref:uncharacterized protein LOC121734300 n=1 Tax=Aricia agestis TaxID=91739 RepID=UPI001C20947C|nr:uncharacterized protein LOC121734300 [Aricia agestis]